MTEQSESEISHREANKSKLLLLNSKNLEGSPVPSRDLENPIVTAPSHLEDTPVKQVRDLRESSEQLQIAKGADGAAAL